MMRLRRVSIREGVATSKCPTIVVMVGLPARGKTYMAKKLARYLNWIGIKTQVFNNGNYVRELTTKYSDHNFFRADNVEALNMRRECALAAINDASNFVEKENGQVAIFDATNTTRDRRRMLYELIVHQLGYRLFFIESICDDPHLVEQNIKDVKVNGPDYRGMAADIALSDFLKRIEHYKKNYAPIDEEKEGKLSFMKIYNTGEKVLVHKHHGHTEAKIIYYLISIHIIKRSIFFVRHGESKLNMQGRIGGDSELTERGQLFAKRLAEFVDEQDMPDLQVWTSWMKRTVQTAEGIDAPQERWKALNELDAGQCEEMTYAEIKEKFPEDFAARDKNKFTFRYRKGESYEDLVARLEPVIMDLERTTNVLVVAHQAVLRCLLAYFLDKPTDELPYIEVPLHTAIRLTPAAYGCDVQHFSFDVPSVNTHRGKPKVPGSLETCETATETCGSEKDSTD